jgi:hypothetical protein
MPKLAAMGHAAIAYWSIWLSGLEVGLLALRTMPLSVDILLETPLGCVKTSCVGGDDKSAIKDVESEKVCW